MDWDDLRVFLAVARAGSLGGGAKVLGVNHSTVFRRMEALEAKLNVRLFDRQRSGYSLTAAGEEMQRRAERIDEEVLGLDLALTGRDVAMQGLIRVTTADTIAQSLLGPVLKDFLAEHPAINVELFVDQQFFNLSKREADVAIRPTLNPPETLVGRKLGPVEFAAYAATDLFNGPATMKQLENLPWVTPDDGLAHLRAMQWFNAHMKEAHVAVKANTFSAMQGAVQVGLGAAILPTFWGEQLPGVERISEDLDGAGSELWILTHEDLRRTARIKAFMDVVGGALSAALKRAA